MSPRPSCCVVRSTSSRNILNFWSCDACTQIYLSEKPSGHRERKLEQQQWQLQKKRRRRSSKRIKRSLCPPTESAKAHVLPASYARRFSGLCSCLRTRTGNPTAGIGVSKTWGPLLLTRYSSKGFVLGPSYGPL